MSNQDLQQVVVAYDGTEGGRLVIERALDLACRAPFHILHVLAVLDSRHGLPILRPAGSVDYRYAGEVQDLLVLDLERRLSVHPGGGAVHFFVHVRIGKPAEEILDQARDLGADLIVIGSHGYHGLDRLVLGSVSERVVREALCPVIVARAKGYPHVDLEPVVEVPSHALHYVPPHRYSYDDGAGALRRSPQWPIP